MFARSFISQSTFSSCYRWRRAVHHHWRSSWPPMPHTSLAVPRSCSPTAWLVWQRSPLPLPSPFRLRQPSSELEPRLSFPPLASWRVLPRQLEPMPSLACWLAPLELKDIRTECLGHTNFTEPNLPVGSLILFPAPPSPSCSTLLTVYFGKVRPPEKSS